MKKKMRTDKILFWILIFAVATVFVMIAFKPPEEAEAEAETIPKAAPTVAKVEKAEPLYDVPLEEGLQAHIKNLCDSYSVDMPLVLAIIGQESNYDAGAIGDDGESIGLMQIQAKHHKGRMNRLEVTDLSDPYQNVTVGIDLLSELMSKEKGTEWAVTAYNAGAAKADYNKTMGIRTEYAEGVLRLREEIG